MWKRAELKAKARASIKRNYIPCILIALVLLFTLGSQQSATVARSGDISDLEFLQLQALHKQYTYLLGPNQVLWNQIELMLGGSFLLITIILNILVFNPLEVGGCGFFVENSEEMPGFGKFFAVFRSEGYWNVVKVLLFRDLFIYLWSMLFIIPGIYKKYEYYMIPYLLSDDPMMSRTDCFRISKEMMYDNKMKTFILELSFFLWEMLSSLSFGLVGIFYVNPYKHATCAELYKVIRDAYWSLNQDGPDIYVNTEGVY